MAYTVKLAGKDSGFPEWTEVDLRLEPHFFATEKEAEQFAQDLNNLAWEKWDRNHPDADEEEHLASLDHAPCFEVEEHALNYIDCGKATTYEQYAESDYKEIAVEMHGFVGCHNDCLTLWCGAYRQPDGTVRLTDATPLEDDGDLLGKFPVADQIEIERGARYAAHGYISVTPFK